MSKNVKIGRPSLPAKERRGKFINTRVSPDEYKAIHEAIKASGVTKTEWVRQKLLSGTNYGK